LLIVEGAASAGRNVATDLRALSGTARHEVFSRAASLADAGKLGEALTALGLLASSRALPARLAVERLPSTRQLAFGLSVLGAFCFIVAFVQLFVGALLAAKVMPAFVSVGGGGAPVDPRTALAVLIPVQAGRGWSRSSR